MFSRYAIVAVGMCGVLASSGARACLGYDILISAGQSNEVGRGYFGSASLTPAQLAARSHVFEVVRQYDADGNPINTITAENFQIVQASEPLMHNTNIRQIAHCHGHAYSLALFMAANEADRTQCVVIVPAARSGTSITQWAPGDELYDDMLTRVTLALSILPNSRVAGISWLQAEQDVEIIASEDTPHPSPLTKVMPDRAVYNSDLTAFLMQLRHDVGCAPAMFGGMAPSFISDYSTIPSVEANAQRVKGAITVQVQAVVAKDPCKNTAFVDGSGLLSNEEQGGGHDYTHYSFTSQYTLSQRYWAAFQALKPAS